MPTKIELETKQRIEDLWESFQTYRTGTESHNFRGRMLNESDVRAVLERLLTDVLGYEPSQIDREPDYADFLLLYRGVKIMVIETKDWGVFKNEEDLNGALRQAFTYAIRHRVKHIAAFDAERFVLAECGANEIMVKLETRINTEQPNNDLFYFTHYGLSKLPKNILSTIECTQSEVAASATASKDEYKTHHSVKLHYSCFAYVGDLRSKSTWKMPYRNEDGSVDTGRIDKAVNYLFGAGGYRGVKARESSVPEAAQPEVARKLALGYQEIGKWEDNSHLKSVQTLWDYLSSRGETDLK